MKKRKTIVGLLSLALCINILIPLNSGVKAATAITAAVVESDGSKITKDCSLSANIMKNANWNFENGEFYWGLINTIDNIGSAYFYVMSITDEKAHEGKYSLMLDGVGGWSNIMIPLNVKKNTNYTFSMWVNATPGLGGSANTVFKIGQVNGELSKVPAQNWFSGDLGIGPYDSQWHQVGITVNSGDNEELAIILADGGGLVFFDEFRFFETNNPTGTAATEPTNLQKVITEINRLNAAASKTSSSTSSKNSTTTSNSTTISQSTEQQSGSASNVVESNISANESTSSGDVIESKEEASSVNSDAEKSTPESNNTALIIIIIAAIVIGAGTALWYFKIRKKA